ncbi:hypothetical protein ACH5RR_012692 [Cinchona calisaya]|uniref:Uncharacterized protein n=1 Tax=Cinchona calisaya TaxID=153742 RepID=A0ABD3A8F7_9GENT
MAVLQSTTGGQPHCYASKSFADVVPSTTLIVRINNLTLYRGEPTLIFTNDEIEVLAFNDVCGVLHLQDDDKDSRKTTKGKAKTVAQNPNPKMAQAWQPKAILKHTTERDSSTARTSGLTNARKQDVIILSLSLTVTVESETIRLNSNTGDLEPRIANETMVLPHWLDQQMSHEVQSSPPDQY